MGGSWDHILRVFQQTSLATGNPTELREEPASTIESGKPTSTPQSGPVTKKVRKSPKDKPKAP